MSPAVRVLFPSLLTVWRAAPAASAADGWSVAPLGGAGRLSCDARRGRPGSVDQATVSVTNRGTRPVSARFVAWDAVAGAGGAVEAGGGAVAAGDAFFVVRRGGRRRDEDEDDDGGGGVVEPPCAQAELTGATT